MTDYRDLGTRIRKAHMEKGMTQEQLAEACGIGPSHISHIETGPAYLSMPVFIEVVNALECSADELLCKEIKIISDTVLSLKDSLRRHHKEMI